jgi:hypothetical protein
MMECLTTIRRCRVPRSEVPSTSARPSARRHGRPPQVIAVDFSRSSKYSLAVAGFSGAPDGISRSLNNCARSAARGARKRLDARSHLPAHRDQPDTSARTCPRCRLRREQTTRHRWPGLGPGAALASPTMPIREPTRSMDQSQTSKPSAIIRANCMNARHLELLHH